MSRNDLPSSGVIGHDKIDMLPIGDVMEEILFPDVAQFTVLIWSQHLWRHYRLLAYYLAEFWIELFV